MKDQSLRGFLNELERGGELERVARSVDPRFELGAVLSIRDGGPALLFERVRGSTMPIVGNVLTSRERFETALGIPAGTLDAHCIAALANPIKPRIVKNAPVQEAVLTNNIDLKTLLPVPTWFERESGPYITAGAIIAEDPETGRRNLSIARLRLDGGSRLMAGIARNHHLSILAEKAAGRRLPIAVAIGNHPAVLLASQMYVSLGEDEFDIAGGLLGEPVDLVHCRSVDLAVPAHAEIVLEGELRADDKIEEGPVSEFHGFYVDYGPGIGVTIRCVTHRRDAIYQAILPGYAKEHCLLGAIAIGAVVCRALQAVIPSVRRVFISYGGMGRLHAIIVMHRPQLGEAKRAILLAIGQVNLLKLVIAVDDDIDPEDSRQVEWSLAARFRGAEDLVVLPGVKADRCDPVHDNLVVTKIGMVATTRPGDGAPGSRSEFARVPAEIEQRVRGHVTEWFSTPSGRSRSRNNH